MPEATAPSVIPKEKEWADGVRLPIKDPGRSWLEIAFIVLFVPAVVAFYSIYKWPTVFGSHEGSFYLFGKSPGFFYGSVYSGLVCGIALWALIRNENLYKRGKKPAPMGRYQRAKFTSIFLVQLIVFWILPFIVGPLIAGQSLLEDAIKPPKRDYHVYVSGAFMSLGTGIYIFGVIPIAVYFFGKRYCAWFCACGNLAETIGITSWGKKWVYHGTPRGPVARRLEVIQTVCLVFALAFGVLFFLDGLKLFNATSVVGALQSTQDLVIDFIFGSVIGVAAYPFLGSRVWCRYGCPLAKGMQLLGGLTRSRFQVEANEACKGLNLCTQACPMGIDVAAFAHKDRRPTNDSFGLAETPCIGCGGCIEICPTEALSFAPVGKKSPAPPATPAPAEEVKA